MCSRWTTKGWGITQMWYDQVYALRVLAAHVLYARVCTHTCNTHAQAQMHPPPQVASLSCCVCHCSGSARTSRAVQPDLWRAYLQLQNGKLFRALFKAEALLDPKVCAQ